MSMIEPGFVVKTFDRKLELVGLKGFVLCRLGATPGLQNLGQSGQPQIKPKLNNTGQGLGPC